MIRQLRKDILASLAGKILQQYETSVWLPTQMDPLAMTPEKIAPRVIGSVTIRCEGVGNTIAPLLSVGRAGVSLTVYEDGTRELGCSYLHPELHTCLAEGRYATKSCCHLYPVRARELPDLVRKRVAKDEKYKLN